MGDKFSAGDEVILKSGGPHMTVESSANGHVSCMWFHESDLRQATFGEALLITREDQAAKVAGRRQRSTVAIF